MQLGIDAAVNAHACKVTAIITYLGYSRQDVKEGIRGCLGSKVLARNLVAQGLNNAILIDLHSPHVANYFNIPVDHLQSYYIFKKFFNEMLSHKLKKDLMKDVPIIIASPDQGGVKRASIYAKKLQRDYPNNNISSVMCYKWRNKPNSIERMELIGNVKGAVVFLVDDIWDTGGTILKASSIIKNAGAIDIFALVTHGVFSDETNMKKIGNPKLTPLSKLYIGNTTTSVMNLNREQYPNISVVKIHRPIGKIIKAIQTGLSADEMLEKADQILKK
jgi:ribose-phosphate pyrophosphokinase